jgi:uncharacterized protein (TIGR03083 family)
MQLSPRYDGPPRLIIDLTDDPSVPLLRQRARLADQASSFGPDEWATPSRCGGWTVQDVLAHLVGVNQFWALSISAGRAGRPTRYLTSFDPVSTPAQMVEGMRGQTSDEVLAALVRTNQELAESIDGLDASSWATCLAEAPPGHIALRALALHALWDAWVHERDVLLPLGHAVAEEPDEIVGSLRYAAALGPAILMAAGEARTGSFVVDVSDPAERFVVDVGTSVVVHDGDAPDGALCLTGPAVDLAEALSVRRPLPIDPAHDDAWILGGLQAAFADPA